MPIYVFRCLCGNEEEALQPIGVMTRKCGCGAEMKNVPTHQAMVLSRGNGLYPSEQKFVRGTAPYSGGGTKAWGSYDPDIYDMHGKLLEPQGA